MDKRRTHNLKIHKQYFDYVLSELKQFEIRKNDRDFKERDLINLRESDNLGDKYTGRALTVEITYITEYKQLRGYVVLGIKRLDTQEELEALKAENERLREAVKFFDNKIYILERSPKDELSDRYRVEVTKLRKEVESVKQTLGGE